MLGLVLVCAVAYGYAHQRNIQQRYSEFQENQAVLDNIRQEVETLRRQVNETRNRVKRMESDPLEIEAAIRRDRRMTRNGEIVFHVEAPPPASRAPRREPDKEQRGFDGDE